CVGASPCLLRGPYFAISASGLAELAKHAVIWFEPGVTGTVGRLILAPPGPLTLYYTVLGVTAAAVAAALLLRRSRWGYALAGLGADEERAETLGIRTTFIKIATFCSSAAFLGPVSPAMAPRSSHLHPQGV